MSIVLRRHRKRRRRAQSKRVIESPSADRGGLFLLTHAAPRDGLHNKKARYAVHESAGYIGAEFSLGPIGRIHSIRDRGRNEWAGRSAAMRRPICIRPLISIHRRNGWPGHFLCARSLTWPVRSFSGSSERYREPGLPFGTGPVKRA